jgi:protein-disulfide isomerase
MLAILFDRRRAGAVLVTSLMVGVGLGSLGCDPGKRRSHAVPSASAPQPAASSESECDRLVSKLCGEFGRKSETCQLVGSQAPEFGPKRCEQMLSRWDQTVSELERREDAQQVLSNPKQTTPHGPAPALGPEDAKITLVEFSDFTCRDCGRGSGVARSVKNLHGKSVRFVFRQYPNPKSPHARLAAEASLAAHAQGKFWEYHDTLFANPHDLSRPALERYAGVVGLDVTEFRRALDEKRYAEDVAKDLELGRAMLVIKLPALFVNGSRVRFPYGVKELGQVIAGAKGGVSPQAAVGAPDG